MQINTLTSTVGVLLMLEPGETADYAVTGTYTGQINLEESGTLYHRNH